MGDWTLCDASGPVRSGLDFDGEEGAKALVDWNRENGNTAVYAQGPNGQHYPEA